MLRFSVLSHPAVFLGYKQLCIVNQTSNIGLQGLKTNRVINLNHGTVGLANLCRVSSLASLLFSVLSTEHVSEVMATILQPLCSIDPHDWLPEDRDGDETTETTTRHRLEPRRRRREGNDRWQPVSSSAESINSFRQSFRRFNRKAFVNCCFFWSHSKTRIRKLQSR